MKFVKHGFRGLLVTLVLVTATHSQVSQRLHSTRRLHLNGDWKFQLNGATTTFYRVGFDDGDWADIPVPGNWEMAGFEIPHYGSDVTGDYGLYRTRFTVPSYWTDRRILLRFEGVAFGFQCWIDGEYAGKFESAYQRAEFDVTSLVEPGEEHLLAVYVYKKPKGYEFDTNDAWILSGIYRDVSILAQPPVHISDFTMQSDEPGDFRSVVD